MSSDTSGSSMVGLRRPADLAPGPDPGHDPALLAQIHDEIRTQGPMTFARFMELALYAPGLGYYATGRRGPGRRADFLTAPESHPIFGWAVARQVEEIWSRLGRPGRFTVREFGAGTGALAAAIVDGLGRSGSPLLGALRYRVVERAPARLLEIEERFAIVGAGPILEPDDEAPIEGVILANEVLDALPVHRVEGRGTGDLEELFVGLDGTGQLATIPGAPSSPDLAARLAAEGITLRPGQRAEICLAVDRWMADAAAGLGRGAMLLIDYGHPAAALYDQARGSLLRAYTRHRVHDDPFASVGRQDLTAHVDLTAVEHAAADAGLTHLGTTTQAAFLAGLGAGELLVGLQTAPAMDMGTYLGARAALHRMLDPGVTGSFAVLVFGRGMPEGPALTGLAGGLPAGA